MIQNKLSNTMRDDQSFRGCLSIGTDFVKHQVRSTVKSVSNVTPVTEHGHICPWEIVYGPTAEKTDIFLCYRIKNLNVSRNGIFRHPLPHSFYIYTDFTIFYL